MLASPPKGNGSELPGILFRNEVSLLSNSPVEHYRRKQYRQHVARIILVSLKLTYMQATLSVCFLLVMC